MALTILLSVLGNEFNVYASYVSDEAYAELYSKIFNNSIENNDIHYSFSNGVLTVTGTGYANEEYKDVCGKSDIKEVVIEPGVVGICNFAFEDCSKLSKVTIPESVVEMGFGAFGGTRLKEINIPSTVKK